MPLVEHALQKNHFFNSFSNYLGVSKPGFSSFHWKLMWSAPFSRKSRICWHIKVGILSDTVYTLKSLFLFLIDWLLSCKSTRIIDGIKIGSKINLCVFVCVWVCVCVCGGGSKSKIPTPTGLRRPWSVKGAKLLCLLAGKLFFHDTPIVTQGLGVLQPYLVASMTSNWYGRLF